MSKKIKLADIAVRKDNGEPVLYNGYIWWSDSPEPIVLINKPFILDENELKKHFIYEGQLLSDGKSYSIKYIDGEYRVYCYLVHDNGIEMNFLPYRMQDKESKVEIVGLKFKQYWVPVADEYCEGMEVLQPAELVFLGFQFSN